VPATNESLAAHSARRGLLGTLLISLRRLPKLPRHAVSWFDDATGRRSCLAMWGVGLALPLPVSPRRQPEPALQPLVLRAGRQNRRLIWPPLLGDGMEPLLGSHNTLLLRAGSNPALSSELD